MSTQVVEQIFSAAWDEAIASASPAKFAESVRHVEYRSFTEKVFGGYETFIRDFVQSAYAGHVYVFLNAYSPSVLRELKDAAYSWASMQSSQQPPLVNDVTDYRSRRNWHAEEEGFGYSSTYDMLHFYPWNNDPIGAFSVLADQFKLARLISGLGDDSLKNLPSDGIVDRIEISHYPTGIGGIAFHSDPFMAQRFQLTVTLNEYGKDFKRGGFAVGKSDGTILQVEPLAPFGAMYGFLPSICHGVEIIDPDLPADWDSPAGRWFAATTMVTSSVIQNRQVTLPVAGFPTLRQQIAQYQQKSV